MYKQYKGRVGKIQKEIVGMVKFLYKKLCRGHTTALE